MQQQKEGWQRQSDLSAVSPCCLNEGRKMQTPDCHRGMQITGWLPEKPALLSEAVV